MFSSYAIFVERYCVMHKNYKYFTTPEDSCYNWKRGDPSIVSTRLQNSFWIIWILKQVGIPMDIIKHYFIRIQERRDGRMRAITKYIYGIVQYKKFIYIVPAT